MPIYGYLALRTDERLRFDRGGALARAGRIDDALVDAFLSEPYFRQAPPKTTGREQFGRAFLDRHRAALRPARAQRRDRDVDLAHRAQHRQAIIAHAPHATRTIVSGGGAHNDAIVDGLRDALAGMAVERSDVYGIDVDAEEAIRFAVLGLELLRGRPAGLPAVTGARGPRLLGALAPVELPALLERVAAEVAA